MTTGDGAKSMRAQIETRLQRLENRMVPRVCSDWVFVMHPISEERRKNLQPDERVVFDRYRHSGMLITATERITTDPNDPGRFCPREGYLLDVIERLHQDCYWRERSGSCKDCEGTPVAGT